MVSGMAVEKDVDFDPGSALQKLFDRIQSFGQ